MYISEFQKKKSLSLKSVNVEIGRLPAQTPIIAWNTPCHFVTKQAGTCISCEDPSVHKRLLV